MDNINLNAFNDYFYNIYKKNGYLDKYGGSVIATTFTLFFFFIILSYYYVMQKIDPIKENWAEERCKPSVMPFAGIINAPPNKSKLEFAQENFAECTTIILGGITSYFVKPFYFISDLLVKLFKVMMNSVNMIRTLIFWIRMKIKKMFEYVIARLMNVLIPMQKMLIKLKDSAKKMIGVMVGALYTVMSAFMGLKAFMGSFMTIVIIFLVLLVALIIIMWILPWTWPVAAATTVFFVLLSIPLVLIAIWVDSVLDMAGHSVPNKPGCFDKNTKIKTRDGEISIKNILPGTILSNGSTVTSIFKLALNNRDMYKLDNIIVSGSHMVFCDSIGWIKVEEHPNAKLINNYRQPFIYCLGTDNKRIFINNTKFLDWDDLEPIDIIKLKNLKYLNHNHTLKDIHKFLESGLHGDTFITLENNKIKKIKNIKVNDILKFDERVLGIVKIDTKNIDKIIKYKFNGLLEIIGAPNLHFNDKDLGNFNTLKLTGENQTKPKYLYHLLTDTGHFSINGFKIRDYNSAIENILDIHEKINYLF